MEKEYYIVVNDKREGPFSFEQLRVRNIEPSTLVWTAGLADWVRADTLPELEPIMAARTRVDDNESAFGTYARPEAQRTPAQGNYGGSCYGAQQNYGAQNGYGNQNGYGYGNTGSSNNWYTLAIIATVVGFLVSCVGGILGIFAILQGSKARDAERIGDNVTARSAWSTCKTLTIISFVLSGIGLVANVWVFTTVFNNPALTNL